MRIHKQKNNRKKNDLGCSKKKHFEVRFLFSIANKMKYFSKKKIVEE